MWGFGIWIGVWCVWFDETYQTKISASWPLFSLTGARAELIRCSGSISPHSQPTGFRKNHSQREAGMKFKPYQIFFMHWSGCCVSDIWWTQVQLLSILVAIFVAGFVLNCIGFKTLVYHCGAIVVGFNFTSVGDWMFGYKSQEDTIGVISVNLKITISKPNLALNSATISPHHATWNYWILFWNHNQSLWKGDIHHPLNPVTKLGGPNWDRKSV